MVPLSATNCLSYFIKKKKGIPHIYVTLNFTFCLDKGLKLSSEFDED